MSRLTARNFTGYSKRFSYSPTHYDIELDLDPRRQRILVCAAMTLLIKQNSRNLFVLLTDKCRLDSINYLGLGLPNKASPAGHGLNLLSIALPIRPEVGERIVVSFNYSLPVTVWDSSLELVPEDNWYPFSPLAGKYTSTVSVTGEEALRVLGPGDYSGVKPAGTRACHRWVADASFSGIHVVAGNFLKTSRATAPPLEVAYPRRLLNQAKAIANYCEELLPFLAETLGPAPFPSLGVVLTENPEPKISSSYYLSSVSNGALERLKDTYEGKSRYVHQYQELAENLAQHWLREHLPAPAPQEQWYLEGLAAYVSWLAVEAKYGGTWRQELMLSARERLLGSPNITLCQGADVAWGGRPQWVTDSAAWLYWVCQGLIGDAFLPALRECLACHSEVAPAAAEFFADLGKLTGHDLPPLYKAWCQSRNRLQLGISAGQNTQQVAGNWQFSFRLIDSGRFYWPYPVELELTLADGSKLRQQLPIQKEPHFLETKSPVRLLVLDPGHKLLNWAGVDEFTI